MIRGQTRATHLFRRWEVEQQVCLNQSLGSNVEEGDIFISETREVANAAG